MKYDQNEPIQPKFEVNAPDLYIPAMAFLTYGNIFDSNIVTLVLLPSFLILHSLFQIRIGRWPYFGYKFSIQSGKVEYRSHKRFGVDCFRSGHTIDYSVYFEYRYEFEDI